MNDPSAFAAAYELAEQLRDEGMSQQELYQLYDQFCERHHDDTDDTRLDAVLDTLDFITGWCHPGRRLFPAAAEFPSTP
ncbi:MAG: hypothetical protein ACO1TE_28130 [Prosthecobacter sp.]